MRWPLSKNRAKSQRSLAEPRSGNNAGLDSLCRQLRILRAELRQIRGDITILRRDVYRIDRKVYRDGAASLQDNSIAETLLKIQKDYGG